MWLEKATRGSTSFKSLSIVISQSGTTRKEQIHVANSTVVSHKKIVHSTICCIESQESWPDEPLVATFAGSELCLSP